MKKSLILAGMLSIGYAYAQEYDGKVGINTQEPKATLDITAYKTDGTTKEGLLIPRMKKADVAKIVSPEISTIIYINNVDYTVGADTNANNRVANVDGVGFYYYNGTQWIRKDKYEWDRMKVTTGSNTDDVSYLINTKSPSHVTYNKQTGRFNIHSAQTERNDTPLWVRWEPINVNGAKYTQEGYASVSTVQTQPNTQFSTLAGSFSNITVGNDVLVDTARGIQVYNNFTAKSTNKESVGVYARANIFAGATMGNHTGVYSYIASTTPSKLDNVYFFRAGYTLGLNTPYVADNAYGLYVDNIKGKDSSYSIYTNTGKVRLGDLADVSAVADRTVVVDKDGVLKVGSTTVSNTGVKASTTAETCSDVNLGAIHFKEVEISGTNPVQKKGVFGFCTKQNGNAVWVYLSNGGNIMQGTGTFGQGL